MTQVGSFILFRKQEIDCACAIAVIILSSLNQPYWIPQAVAVPEAEAGRKIDFLGQQENKQESEKEKDGGTEGEKKRETETKLGMESFQRQSNGGNKDRDTSKKQTTVVR